MQPNNELVLSFYHHKKLENDLCIVYTYFLKIKKKKKVLKKKSTSGFISLVEEKLDFWSWNHIQDCYEKEDTLKCEILPFGTDYGTR